MYSGTVMEHFIAPQNVGHMLSADGIGRIGEPGCGDNCVIFIKVNEEIIDDIRVLIFGCGAAIACGSMTTVLAKGCSIRNALKITQQNIIDALDGLPEPKQHCSNLGVSALQAAIRDYLRRQGEPIENYL
ncbi:Iron-sulfur cluster assembly scaffold protein IscU [bioreactor metagenome]|uniref:Iron-sulfur cluster assembly scaffold protein IscU n=1 Tax=bioreactor metagenome TaxID=1076179 RepID=A0A645JNX9_9ZZZZ